jgi:hypothetical protein
MQCPPTPMLGKNGINPNGLVDAAFIASWAEKPRALEIIENSLTNDIFI